MIKISTSQWDKLSSTFRSDIQKDVPLSKFTAARVGGSADAFIITQSVDRLKEVVQVLWDFDIPFFLLGGGSNVLISDRGVREVVILNRTNLINIKEDDLSVEADSGASIGQIARMTSARGLSGLEWATGVPGTVGGAVYGNSGAHGSDVEKCLDVAKILHRDKGEVLWTVDQMRYTYRSSVLKRGEFDAVVLSANFRVTLSSKETTKNLVEQYSQRRKNTQPPGASLGSMFKNPPDDYAGRLIERAGLKGTCIGGATISPVHSNFFITSEDTSARDILALVRKTQNAVSEKFGILLELEIELLGDWENDRG